MARIEYLPYKFYEHSLNNAGALEYTEENKEPIEALPQIFWKNGESWSEANLYAIHRAAPRMIDSETVKRKMKHLLYYACYLEDQGKDWRHFPARTEDKVLIPFRKHLLDNSRLGLIATSTASNCINAVVEFYRFALDNNLINPKNKMWNERLASVPFYDSVGFRSVLTTSTTDLRIPNKKREGTTLEDGLTPLSAAHTSALLEYTAKLATPELHLMLCKGFFSGARNETVGTLTVSGLYIASPDPNTEGIFRLPAGPGTSIKTKGSVSGSLWVPEALLNDLKKYGTSTRRLLREAKAKPEHKDLLFLTRSGKPYEVGTLDRLIEELREKCCSIGMRFMRNFIFHECRATFGTWLARELIMTGLDTSTVMLELKSAMFHADERTTWRYIKFLEVTKAKIEIADKFNELFTGIKKRDWSTKDV
nr:site-specific integrase [Herbaspirillum sp. ASV7]